MKSFKTSLISKVLQGYSCMVRVFISKSIKGNTFEHVQAIINMIIMINHMMVVSFVNKQTTRRAR